MEKKCNKCGETKDLSNFIIKRIRKSGHIQYGWCKTCINQKQVDRRVKFKAEHPELFVKTSKPKVEKVYTERYKLFLEHKSAGLKKCYNCGVPKPLDQFTLYTITRTGKKKRNTRCKQCDSARIHIPAEKPKPKVNLKFELLCWMDDLKKSCSCNDCGTSFEDSPWLCDFHHVDPANKAAEISKLLMGAFNKEIILSEINKCIPLCSNCHRTRHNKASYLKRKSKRELRYRPDQSNSPSCLQEVEYPRVDLHAHKLDDIRF